MIHSLIIMFNLFFRLHAHGDHSIGAHTGEEELGYYDRIPDDAFSKTASGELVGSINFKKRSLPIKLWKNDLDQTNQTTNHILMSGVVTDIPGSYIRMSAFNNTIEGMISLPKRGIIRVALASRYNNINGNSKTIAYHSNDLLHLSKRSLSHSEFWKPLDSHLEKRGLGRRQCRPRVLIAADISEHPMSKIETSNQHLNHNQQQSQRNSQSALPIVSKVEGIVIKQQVGTTAQYQGGQQQPNYQPPPQQQQPRYQYPQQQQPQQPQQQQPRYQYPQQQQPQQPQQQQPRYQYPQKQQPQQPQQQQPRYQYPQQQTPRSSQQQPQQAVRYTQYASGTSAATSRLTSCNAGLIADYSFYLQHRNQPGGIEAYMQSLFNEVSGHFYSQTGVSLRIKYMYVIKNPNDGSGLGYNYADPSSSVSYINSKSAKLPGFNAEDLCVVHILSSAKFTQQAVGVAFIGSVCSPGANAGIASDNYGKLSRSDYTSVIMHEIGHVFGSAHDTSFPSEKQICIPQTNKYVMYPSVQGGSANAHRFSPCSLRSIQRTISNPKKQCWNLSGQRIRPGAKFASAKSEMIVDYLKYDL